MVQKELAALLVEGLKDPRVGFATITEVRMADDLRNATVYVSVYGTDEERAASLEGLQAASGFLKREVAQRLRLRFAPELSFKRDESLDRAERLETLLGAISRGEIETPEAAAVPPVPVDMARKTRESDELTEETPPSRRGRSGRGRRSPRNRRRS